ncbi:unnamed protein product [Kluyveromyces dobzhanskii CBS 2104]|uniref:Tubulin gamma chain n=1 Tax=Kluyveromyces dobzhanskii CBS 2104 TaxID=1427455 RepID=A0A0A8L520_9SACH|nr:unnamed protein product [Kluyveromyces dobzhanskii CBS 2104]
MTGEIITLQVGQCGNQVGREFWSQLAKEHGIGHDGLSLQDDSPSEIREDHAVTFFKQNDSNRYTPRALLFDLEPSIINDIRNNFPGFFNDRNVWLSQDNLGAGNTWSKGYDYGTENQDQFINMIDREIDATENFEGFQLIHSVAGGTGSGLGSNLLELLADSHHKKLVTTYSVFPSDESEVVVQPYNTMLTLRRLIEDSDASVVFDNNALSNITARVLRDSNVSYAQSNQVISTVMSSITNSIRFPSYMFSSLPSIFSTIIPTPDMHFLVPSFTSFTTDFIPEAKTLKRSTAYDVILDLFDPNNSMVTQNSDDPVYIAIYDLLQGSVEQSDITRAILKTQKRIQFAPWSKSSLHVNVGKKSAYNKTANSDYVSGLMLSNSTAVNSLLKKTCNSFDAIFNRGAFLHKFQNGRVFEDGWDEFKESREVVQSVIDEYTYAAQDSYIDDILLEDNMLVGNDDNTMNINDDNNII